MILTTILSIYAGCCLAILNNTEYQKKSLKITKFFDFDEEDINDLSHDDKSIDTTLTSKLNSDSFNPVELDYEVDGDFEKQYENYAMERNSDDSYPEAEQRDYGHSSEGYSEHGTGYTVPTKKPGPYGYPTPNYKCEKSSETLYVTETEWTYDTKCFNVYKVKCTEGYDEGKDIGYEKHCNEFTVTRCHTVYDSSSEERCWTVYKKQCEMIYETVEDWEYQQHCSTSYEEECHGYGYHQECQKVPKEHCKQVPKKVEKSVPGTKCKQVPDKRCQDFPINVPRKECKDFPKTVCTQDPVNVKKKIPKKTCVQIPQEVCNKIPRQIIREVPKKVGKKVCSSTKPSTSYGQSGSSYGEPSPSYGAPSYKTPEENYNPPAPSYSPPVYSAPAYSAPSDYGTAAASVYGYKRSTQRRQDNGTEYSYLDNWEREPGR